MKPGNFRVGRNQLPGTACGRWEGAGSSVKRAHALPEQPELCGRGRDGGDAEDALGGYDHQNHTSAPPAVIAPQTASAAILRHDTRGRDSGLAPPQPKMDRCSSGNGGRGYRD
jgi:hypothetical protein